MKRICFVLQVRPERLEEYKERHRAVWPEMQQALSETGWSNYSLFLREDGMLVGYLETNDFEAALRGMSERDVNRRWQKEMGEFFMNPPGVAPDRHREHDQHHPDQGRPAGGAVPRRDHDAARTRPELPRQCRLPSLTSPAGVALLAQ